MSPARTSRMKGKGRKKIEIKKIIEKVKRQVTFSKRCKGLFKKASELCTICGVDLVIIVFSPSGKVYSFGHPSVEAGLQRYLFQAPHPTSETMVYILAQQNVTVRELHRRLSYVNNQLDSSKKHGEELARRHKETHAQFLGATQVEEMNMSQLEKFRATLYELKNHVTSCGADVVATNPQPH